MFKKSTSKVGIGIFLDVTYQITYSTVKFLKTFTLRLGNNVCPWLYILFYIVLQDLTKIIRKIKGKRWIKIKKKMTELV